MLAALIATRQVPTPPLFFYSNQFVAATTTFLCITLTRQAALLTTDPAVVQLLLLSQTGHEAILDQLNRFYYRMVNYLSSDANIIDMPSDLYLSNQIAGAVATVTVLQSLVATMAVAPVNVIQLGNLQSKVSAALAVLKSLGVPLH